MKRLNVVRTANGWLVIMGEGCNVQQLDEDALEWWSFNELGAALEKIRQELASWHEGLEE